MPPAPKTIVCVRMREAGHPDLSDGLSILHDGVGPTMAPPELTWGQRAFADMIHYFIIKMNP